MKLLNSLLAFFFMLIHVTLLAQDSGSWIAIDSLHERRMNHAGVQLNNGNILITGGYTPTEGYGTNSTEILNINTFKWSKSAPMNKGRALHDIVKLNNGSIMVIAGYLEVSCEIFSNEYKYWVFTDSIKMKRYYGHTITTMKDGNVLIIGGYSYNDINSNMVQRDCEIYNVVSGKWNTIAALNIGRFGHSSTLLDDGRILVTGGRTIVNDTFVIVNTSEVYDPITDKWTYTAPMHYKRMGHSATLLSTGKVLVVGGRQNTTELYDPITDSWEVIGQVFLAVGHNRAFTILNEKYLLLIHDINDFILTPGWELYSLENFESVYYQKFNRMISDQFIVKLNENRVLIAGGTEAIVTEGSLTILPTQFCHIYGIHLTGIGEKDVINAFQNNISLNCFPNPFNTLINISWEMNTSDWISLELYNSSGEKVSTIFGGMLSAGNHVIKFNMNSFSSGVYFVKAFYENKFSVCKIVYLK